MTPGHSPRNPLRACACARDTRGPPHGQEAIPWGNFTSDTRTRVYVLTLSDQLARKVLKVATTIADQEHRLSRRALAAVRALRKLEADKSDLEIRIKAQKAILTAELAPGLGEKAVGVDGRGTKLVSVKVAIVRTINSTLLRKINPELADECTTESSRTTVTLAPVVAE